ncbi:serine ase [Fusarium agapanthi]|uniref:Serine ase n=1 Tax=Fusarium agapanthi TaxID=1803897 RepID=A0A9P5E2Q6_9HYPO|nr:serine ase [Fusarium agapanthi]
MVAVTAIQDEAGAVGTKIHLFYNLENKNIGFQFRNEQDTSDIKLNAFDPDSNAHDGFVIYQSHLASTKHYNKELVFGVTEKKSTCQCGQPADSKSCDCPKDADAVDISLISPVYKVVTSAYSDNYKIATCSSNVNTWIYYFKKNPKADNALSIFEAVIGPTYDKAFSTNTILPGSALAAYWDAGTKKHNIIYQGVEGNQLRQYVVGGSDGPIDAAKGFKAKSTLAVAVTEAKAFLYFVDADNSTITRVTKKVGGTKWGHEQTVTDADKIKPDSQLSVTVAAGANHLFYEAESTDKSELTHVIDSWEEGEE